MTDRNAIDFVVGDAASDDGDEELASPGPRRGWWPWAVAGAIAVVVGAALLVDRGGDNRPTATAPTPTASDTGFSLPPDVGGVTMTAQVPEGNRHPRAPFGCPADAECYVDHGVSAGVLAALRQRFAGAQLTGAASVLANRTGRFGPDLVSRVVHVRAGPTDVTVTIRKPVSGDRANGAITRHGDLRIVEVTAVDPAFTVTVVVEQYGVHRPAPRGTVDDIAHDRRLVSPQ